MFLKDTVIIHPQHCDLSFIHSRERGGERKRVKKDRRLERDSEKRERSFLADRDKWCSSLSCVWRYSREEGQTQILFLFLPQTLECRLGGLFLCSSHEHCGIYAEVDTSIAQSLNTHAHTHTHQNNLPLVYKQPNVRI